MESTLALFPVRGTSLLAWAFTKFQCSFAYIPLEDLYAVLLFEKDLCSHLSAIGTLIAFECLFHFPEN